MSLSTLKPMACRIPPVIEANGSCSKVSKVTMVNRQALPALQMKNEDQLLLQESSTITTSRREIMQLTAASLCFVSLFFPVSAEARPRNVTMRQKIMQKLEELRQKAGLSKPKDEGEEKKQKDEDKEKKSKPMNETVGKQLEPKDGVEEPETTSEQSSAQAQKKESSSLPTLPNFPLPNFLKGKIV